MVKYSGESWVEQFSYCILGIQPCALSRTLMVAQSAAFYTFISQSTGLSFKVHSVSKVEHI